VHILKGEYPVAPGRIVGHEPVGIIHELGSEVTGYKKCLNLILKDFHIDDSVKNIIAI
jgi:D-arabinose 1-dehydrogenase-like Zn-dependent alcohol dehydrogenase